MLVALDEEAERLLLQLAREFEFQLVGARREFVREMERERLLFVVDRGDTDAPSRRALVICKPMRFSTICRAGVRASISIVSLPVNAALAMFGAIRIA